MAPKPPQQVTQLLIAWSNGDQAARDELMPLVYEELHRLAHRYMNHERPQGSMAELDWLPDGKSVAYILEDNDSANHTLWLQSLAEETPKKIVELGDEEINSFAVSPDGRTFATVQGVWKHNVVLLRSLK